LDNSVISGHRDSYFSKFDKLKVGDSITTKTSSGTFTYKIKSFRIVKADDRTVIVPTEVATLTLTTCYPFYFIGNAPKRFIVTAVLAS
jgi:sortase A